MSSSLAEELAGDDVELGSLNYVTDEIKTLSMGRAEAIDAAKSNLNFLASLILSEIFRFLFPKTLLAAWQILTTAVHIARGKTKLCIGIPRGFAKTTLLKLYVCYVVLFTNRKFILIVCNTAELAENFVSDVVDMLNCSNIVSMFGRWDSAIEKNTLHLKKFHFRGRPVIIAGMGAKSSLRGLNIKFVRPDVIVMDDMQSREEAESEVEARKTLTWMLGTLMKAAAPDRCLYIFVGNMYPFEGSILKKLKYNPAWISFICGAILEDGESIWPELKPVDELITELEDDTSMGHPEIFMSEVMNDEEAGTRSGVDISLIKGIPLREIPEYAEAGFIIIDPSLGKKVSDDIVLGAVLIYNGVPILRELVIEKFTQQQIIRAGILLALKWGLPAIVIEGTAYQATLAVWFEHFIQQLGITGLKPLLIYPGHINKNSRIIAMFKQLTKQPQAEILLQEELRSQVVKQIQDFNPLKTRNKDDILDVLAYIQPVIAQHRMELELMIVNALSDDQFDRSNPLGVTFEEALPF